MVKAVRRQRMEKDGERAKELLYVEGRRRMGEGGNWEKMTE